MTRARAVLLIVVLAVVAAVLPACGSDRPLAIGALYPRSGPQGTQGSEEERGVALAAQWINEHGGVKGRQIRLVPVDAPRAEAVPQAMLTLHARGVDLVVGSHGSAISAAAADASTRLGMLFWETGAVGQIAPDVAGGRHFFRMAPMGANLGRAAIDFMIDRYAQELHLGRPLRIAVADVDDAYGRAVGDGALDEIRARGAPLAGTFRYDVRTTDFDGLADRIAAARPDVLFVAAYLDDGVALRRATVRRHVHLAASIGTSSSYCHPAFGAQLGADAVGLFASDKPDAADVRPEALTPQARRLLTWASTQYTARYHQEMSAPALSGFSNAWALFGAALPKSRGVTPTSVARAALALRLPEGSLPNGGGIRFSPPDRPDGGANLAASGVIWEWVAPATRAVVWPPAFATHPIATLPLT